MLSVLFMWGTNLLAFFVKFISALFNINGGSVILSGGFYSLHMLMHKYQASSTMYQLISSRYILPFQCTSL
jgi:hypothetical protein